jgi:hypothetical protein
MAEPVWQAGRAHNWRDQAFVQMALYSSRDGRRWYRASAAGAASPWVAHGTPGSPDYGMACFCAAGGPLVNGRGQMVLPVRRRWPRPSAAFPLRTMLPPSTRPKRWPVWQYLAAPFKQEQLSAPLPGDFRSVPLPSDSETYADRKRWWHQRSSLHGVSGSIHAPRPAHPKRSVGGLVLREDGWARLAPTHEHGRVITKQFVFSGGALRVNADTAFGFIEVSQGPWSHSHAAWYASPVIVHTKYTQRRLNDPTARG